VTHRLMLEGEALARLRRRVLERAANRCENPLCRSARSGEIDHAIPRSQGGPDTYEVLVLLCGPCHRLKHAGTLLVIPRGDGTFTFLDTRRAGPRCTDCQRKIDTGEVMAVPTPNGGYRWVTQA
jgi:5-methylcytosine-specific restriction endonuclease McrA